MELEARFDTESPFSLVRVTSGAFRTALLDLAESHPDLLTLDEPELRLKVWGPHKQVPQYMHLIRLNFWSEYAVSQKRGGSMNLDRVWRRACSQALWYRIFQTPHFLAWIILEPMNYTDALEEGLARAVEEMRAILDMPNTDKNGRVNKTVVESKIRIFAMFDARKHGAYKQQIENKNLNLSADMKDVNALIEQMSDADLDRKLKELDKKLMKDSPTRPTIELEASEYTPVTGTSE